MQGRLRPDYTLLLDAPVSVGMSRAQERGELDRFEQEQQVFFERVRAAYLRLARESSGRYRVVDASCTLLEVEEQLVTICEELSACWGVRNG